MVILRLYCFLFAETVGVVNELHTRLSLCVKFVDRFQHNLKGRALTEPIRLVTFVETAVGLLNFKVNYKQTPQKTACVRHFAVFSIVHFRLKTPSAKPSTPRVQNERDSKPSDSLSK